jgi:hypothetical protein
MRHWCQSRCTTQACHPMPEARPCWASLAQQGLEQPDDVASVFRAAQCASEVSGSCMQRTVQAPCWQRYCTQDLRNLLLLLLPEQYSHCLMQM